MSRVIRVVIADDEPLARVALERALADIDDLTIVGVAAHGAETVDMVRRERPDVLVLDIHMPGLDGFGVLEALGNELPPAVVFVTAFDAHAVRAFQAYAVDYVVKPFDETRLAVGIERARQRVRAHETADRMPTSTAPFTVERLERLLTSLMPAAPSLERFVVRVGARSVVVPVADVDWIEAADNYACLHVGTARHFIRDTMRALDARLDSRQFARIHRSAIVNLSRVKELKALTSGDHELLLHDGTTLVLSRSWKDSFEQRLGSPL